ncbi:Neurochondrin-domain-containing protein [Nemania abortiva]|nr:Neurochondrin-domain-containing protein [Nemania abortiva]
MESPEVQKIHQLLAAKDDTSRFVGLLLLKTTLDKHASDLEQEQVAALWNSISPRFLDRLIRTGSHSASEQKKQSRDMLDVAVAVIYTFTKLLNDCALNERFYARIPNLANAVLYSSDETTRRIVDLIHVLVQQPNDQVAGGAACFAKLDVNDWVPLIEIAPQYETIFSIFHWAWIKGGLAVPPEIMRAKIDDAFRLFISSFKGNDNPMRLLEFITHALNNIDPNLRSSDPQWLQPVTRLIQDMASRKQTDDGRRAYTQCAAALLAAYPEKAPEALFSDDPNSSEPIAYLFVKMVQVDILSTLHVLIPKLSTSEYLSISHRIAAALDIITAFVGFLIIAADDTTIQHGLTPDRILKLHEDLARTIGDVMEYLRDRWDAFLAGARGIESAQASGSSIFEDPIIPAAIRLIATWLRDDDGETLRTQAAGLIELFTELYGNQHSPDMPEVRLPIIAALEGILQTSDGREAFTDTNLLSQHLYPDLRGILASQDEDLTAGDYIRGSAIEQVLHILLEYDDEVSRYRAGSMDLLESIAKYDVKPVKAGVGVQERYRLDFQTDTLELAVTILESSSRGVPPKFQQRINTALKGIASKLKENWGVLNDESMIARVEELHLD